MYVVGYTFGNRVLRLRLRVAVKLNFRPYIRRYASPNECFEYSYPLSIRYSFFKPLCEKKHIQVHVDNEGSDQPAHARWPDQNLFCPPVWVRLYIETVFNLQCSRCVSHCKVT